MVGPIGGSCLHGLLQVLEALPSLLGLRRLRALSLVGVPGLSTLPQLHPLLQLRRLAHLSLQECEVCSLVLLRPYVVFRSASCDGGVGGGRPAVRTPCSDEGHVWLLVASQCSVQDLSCWLLAAACCYCCWQRAD